MHALSLSQTVASQNTGTVICVTVGNVWLPGMLYRDWVCSTRETWSNVKWKDHVVGAELWFLERREECHIQGTEMRWLREVYRCAL